MSPSLASILPPLCPLAVTVAAMAFLLPQKLAACATTAIEAWPCGGGGGGGGGALTLNPGPLQALSGYRLVGPYC